MKKTSRRPSIVLDAGYVSIKTYDRCKASKIIGLHGQRLCCVILTVFILFLVSSINLTVRKLFNINSILAKSSSSFSYGLCRNLIYHH